MDSAVVTGTNTAKVLVVDDEALCRRLLTRVLTRHGYEVLEACDTNQALDVLRSDKIDIVLTDFEMPGRNGLELVRSSLEMDPKLPCIIMTGYGSMDRSVEALRAGAFWYLEKPFEKNFGTLIGLLGQALDTRRASLSEPKASRRRSADNSEPVIIGRSRALREVLRAAQRVARTRATVLITGESGTGKEVIASVIHRESPRRDKPFVAVNCGAIPEELLESELFGHLRGAFTSAHQSREGRFTRADTGTIFLDEIGDMSIALQPKLLRVLQHGTFEAVGTSVTTHVDVRVIAATNQHLLQRIQEQRFREDLYYRLNVVPIQMPPLRDRVEDIPLLAEFFLERESEAQDRKVPQLTPKAMEYLIAFNWPGNVRELENLMERVVILCDKDEIDAADFRAIYPEAVAAASPSTSARLGPDGIRFQDAVGRYQDELISQALERTGGNKTKAASLLGLNRTTLLEMIKKRGLDPKRPEAESNAG